MQNPLSAAVTMFAVPTFPAAKSRNKPPVYFFAKSIIYTAIPTENQRLQEKYYDTSTKQEEKQP